MLDELLAQEKRLRGPIPSRFQTISNGSENVIEKLENGIVVNEYRKHSNSSVDWVNHPTRILSGPNARRDALSLEWQQAASDWSQKQVRKRDRFYEKGTEAAFKDEDLDPPTAYDR